MIKNKLLLNGIKVERKEVDLLLKKYPMTIVIDAGGKIGRIVPLEIFSGIFLNRKKRFYVKKGSGHYVILESLGGGL